MMEKYRIADEPTPSTLAHLAVNPLFPFLAVMLGGAWIGFAWFALNSFAVGSPTKRQEILWLVGGLVAAFLLVSATLDAVDSGTLAREHLAYAGIVVLVAKLAATYGVYMLQSRTVEIYEYYGGVLRNGAVVVIVALLFGDRVLEPLPPLLQLTLQ